MYTQLMSMGEMYMAACPFSVRARFGENRACGDTPEVGLLHYPSRRYSKTDFGILCMQALKPCIVRTLKRHGNDSGRGSSQAPLCWGLRACGRQLPAAESARPS